LDPKVFDVEEGHDISWCPGCGNFGILKVLKEAFAELDIPPQRILIVSGIGQAAKTPQYLRCNSYHSLHGRALPIATAAKAANPSLVVVAEGGDGDMYAEGGNHFLHAIRRNPDILHLVHNNMVYGLTKGQASPTSAKGFKTPTQPWGVFEEPFNPVAVAIALNASFVARASISDPQGTKEIIKRAIQHKGYAFVDVFQPCVSFNRVNTYRWFRENTYYLEPSHDVHDRKAAFARALETDKLPIGIFYVDPNPRPTFEENQPVHSSGLRPLMERRRDPRLVEEFMEGLR